jgi:hypothetical protein
VTDDEIDQAVAIVAGACAAQEAPA